MIEVYGREVGLLDMAALLIVVVFLIRGIWKGFVWQVAGLLTLVGGLLAAKSLAPKLAPRLHQVFDDLPAEGNWAIIAGWITVFLAVMLLVYLLARLLEKLIDKMRLASYDRLLGGIFGLLKAATIVVVFISFLSLIDYGPLQQRIAQAYSGRFTDFAIERGKPFFPPEVRQRIRQVRNKVKEGIDDVTGPGEESRER